MVRTLMRYGLMCSVRQVPRTWFCPYSIRLSSPALYTRQTCRARVEVLDVYRFPSLMTNLSMEPCLCASSLNMKALPQLRNGTSACGFALQDHLGCPHVLTKAGRTLICTLLGCCQTLHLYNNVASALCLVLTCNTSLRLDHHTDTCSHAKFMRSITSNRAAINCQEAAQPSSAAYTTA